MCSFHLILRRYSFYLNLHSILIHPLPVLFVYFPPIPEVTVTLIQWRYHGVLLTLLARLTLNHVLRPTPSYAVLATRRYPRHVASCKSTRDNKGSLLRPANTGFGTVNPGAACGYLGALQAANCITHAASMSCRPQLLQAVLCIIHAASASLPTRVLHLQL